MSFVAGAAVGILDLDISPWSKGFLQAQSMMEVFPSIVTSFIADPLLGVLDVAQEVVHGGLDLLKESLLGSAESASKLHESAQNVGVSVEALSGLGLVAQQAGASTESVADAFKFLGKNMADVLGGDKTTGKVFADLGVNLTDAAGKARPLEDVMFDVSDAIAATEEPGKRSQAAMALLGRGGTDLVGVMRQGSAAIKAQIADFDQFGAVVHDSSAESGQAFMDMYRDFGIAWTGIKNAIGEPLREALTPVLRESLDWVKSNMPQITEVIKTIVEGVVTAVKFLVDSLLWTFNALKELANTVTFGATNFQPTVLPSALSASSSSRPITINVERPDSSETASQIAAKLKPALDQADREATVRAEILVGRTTRQLGL